MIDAIDEIKIRARLVKRRLEAGEPAALERLRPLREFRGLKGEELAAAGAEAQHKHCLALISMELGFQGFEHACRVLRGDPEERDFGKTLYPRGVGAYLTQWFISHGEGQAMLAELGGYLLAYQKQFFLVERSFIESLGLDPDDADWRALGFDWASDRDLSARARLYAKLIAARAAEAP